MPTSVSGLKVISNNESTKSEMNCPRKLRTIPPQITWPSWGLAFLLGVPSPSLAFGWDVLYWISPKLVAVHPNQIQHIGVAQVEDGVRGG